MADTVGPHGPQRSDVVWRTGVSTVSPSPLRRKPRPERARRRYLDVAEQILSGLILDHHRAGDRLPDERTLADRCHAARSTVREALLALELAGIVEVRRGAGHYLTGVGLPGPNPPISSVTAAAPAELLQVRRLLEPEAAALATTAAASSELRHLQGLVERSAALASQDSDADLDDFLQLDLAFHRDLARMSRNLVLAGLVAQLVDAGQHPLWLLAHRVALRHPEARLAQVEEHQLVLDAMVAGRTEAAARSMAEHLGELSARLAADPADRSAGRLNRSP
ncbi:FadR/GntR family transcriptional regulator [Aciditerrimonas ferrireducens]|uniref:FadR/GntR family transcriptional regulator n=1 Tax=Aciditerrimonas ferrireducens TaxID=667306 RepID=UPI002005B400|nr:FCD domain-containing protein [Aciditerrimonas ferrireducens]MCK4176299.1 FCD domain-containing protein [Aciditerrimonas ferrireducens]